MYKDKIKGMVLGGCLGDVLGSPYEFSQKKINEFVGLVDRPIIRNSQFQGVKKGAVGQITDDTEMTLMLTNSIIKNQCYNKNDVTAGYIEWANSKCPFMGSNTRDLFHGIKTINGYKKRYEEKFSQKKDEWSQSNGCLMRCSPLSLFSNTDYLVNVTVDCRLSNPHPVCIDANIVYVTLLKNLIRSIIIDKAIQNAISLSKMPEVQDVIKQGMTRQPRDITEKKGWILHALYCVFFSLAGNHSTFESAINEIIRLGGDTDTNGAIAGCILGAYFGFEKMNLEKLTSQNIKIIKACDVATGTMTRNDKYTTKNIDNIIDQMIQFYEKNNIQKN